MLGYIYCPHDPEHDEQVEKSPFIWNYKSHRIRKRHLCKHKAGGGAGPTRFHALLLGGIWCVSCWLDEKIVLASWLDMERDGCLTYSLAIIMSPIRLKENHVIITTRLFIIPLSHISHSQFWECNTWQAGPEDIALVFGKHYYILLQAHSLWNKLFSYMGQAGSRWKSKPAKLLSYWNYCFVDVFFLYVGKSPHSVSNPILILGFSFASTWGCGNMERQLLKMPIKRTEKKNWG